MAFQNMTYISPQFRRKGLASEIKKFAYNILINNKHWEDVDTIMTNNHSKNVSMLNVNNHLGFNKVAFFSSWKYDLMET